MVSIENGCKAIDFAAEIARCCREKDLPLSFVSEVADHLVLYAANLDNERTGTCAESWSELLEERSV